MLRKFLLVTLLPLLLAVMWLVGYPGNAPVIEAAGTPGALVPMGDQLGDVGQYYSSSAASLYTTAYIQEAAGVTQTVAITIYNDVGAVFQLFSCALPKNGRISFLMSSSSSITVKNENGTTMTACGTLNSDLHGVYSLAVDGTDNLAVVSRNREDSAFTGGENYASYAASKAVPDAQKATDIYVPAVIATRSGDPQWDTEFVVFNPGSSDSTVTFHFYDDNGANDFVNNSAVIKPKEHRIFSAKQLLYSDYSHNGTLAEKSGWWSVKIHGTNPIAVTTRLFRQPLTSGKIRTENGSDHIFEMSQTKTCRIQVVPLFYPNTSTTSTTLVRVFNTSGSTQNVTAYLYNPDGSQFDSHTYSNIPANGSFLISRSDFSNTSIYYKGMKIVGASGNIVADWWLGDTYAHSGEAAMCYTGATKKSYFPYAWKSLNGYNTYHYMLVGNGTLKRYYTNAAYTQNDGAVNTNAYKDPGETSVAISSGDYWGYVTTDTAWSYDSLEAWDVSLYDHAMTYNTVREDELDDVWYVPFAPAPVVKFAWNAYDSNSSYPTGIYGVAGVNYKPSWAQTLNYIDWGHTVSRGNDANYNGKSVYVPMDWGIGSLDCTKVNNVCVSYPYNNSVRLGAIRNKVPSALAGRPLTLANEPNGIGQANMTLVEQARQVFVYRQWPGHLYSQAFANPFDGEPNQYDRGYTVAQGKTNPVQTDFPTFLEYYNSSEVPGSVPFDGMTVHVYTWKTTLAILYNRLLDWKAAANTNGWDVLIDEYGIIPIRASTEQFCAKEDRLSGGGCSNWQSPDSSVAANECTESCQAGLVDDLRSPIRSAFGSTLTSLMTFATWMPDPCDDCGDDRNIRWSILNHFTTNSTPTSFGDAWITDSVNNP